MATESDYRKEKKQYRKQYQRFKQTKDCSYLDPHQERKKKKKQVKLNFKDKKTDVTLKIDLTTFLLTLKHLIQTKQITKKQLIQLIEKVTCEKDRIIFEDARFSGNYTLPDDADKRECREYWLYLMRNNQLICDICGNLITAIKGTWGLTFDHIFPKSLGGKTEGANASPAHQICNGIKTNHTPEEWEKIGLSVLKAHHIQVNLNNTLYTYKQIRSYR